jgi:putative hydrolase of the HAD superfamily
MQRPAVPESIDVLLLDLDGTLLDLAYDNDFWYEAVPQAYAARNGLDLPEARARLALRFRAFEGTLPWYCIDHWSSELELDIRALKRASAPSIRWLPGARQFLRAQRAAGRRLVLATNAHPVTLQIKDEAVAIGPFFDVMYSSRQFGAPKEDALFWQGLAAAERFDVRRTMFIDDSLSVLRAARAAGLEHVVAVARPDSARPARDMGDFTTITTIADLLGSPLDEVADASAP